MQQPQFPGRHSATRHHRNRQRIRRGAVLVLVAVSMVALMGLLVLVIDGGTLQRQKRIAQAAADAGARAGADEIFRNRPASEVAPAVLRETSRNGFTNGTDATVTVTYPTTSVNAAGSNFVKVVIQRTVSTSFASMFGSSAVTVRARAVAGLGASNTCLVVTEPSAANALSVKSGSLTTVGCGIVVNSSNASSVVVPANGTIDAQSVAVVGGPATEPGGITGAWSAGVPPAPDPLAYLTMPTVGACNGAYGAYANFSGSTLSPGVYCGGIGIDHSTVTFSPGLYIIAGGGMDFKHATVTGNGVTFVLTNAPVANGGAFAYAPITMDVNSDVRLSAMTTGSLAGVLFYADPTAGVAGTLYTNEIGSSSATAFNGSMYFPTQAIAAQSNSPVTINGGVVVKSVNITTGQENIVINGFGAGAGYFALKAARIVE
jgi:hypothetical protein